MDVIINLLVIYIGLAICIIIAYRFVNRRKTGKIRNLNKVYEDIISNIRDIDSINYKSIRLRKFKRSEIYLNFTYTFYFDYMYCISNKFLVYAFALYSLKAFLLPYLIIFIFIRPLIISEILSLEVYVFYSSVVIITGIAVALLKIKVRKIMKSIDEETAINLLANWDYYIYRVYDLFMKRKKFDIGETVFGDGNIVCGKKGMYLIDMKQSFRYGDIKEYQIFEDYLIIELISGIKYKTMRLKSRLGEKEKIVMRKMRWEMMGLLVEDKNHFVYSLMNSLYFDGRK